jgi:hypothetical protein
MIAAVPPEGTEYSDALYDPFWAAAEEIGVPISIHTLTSNRKPNYRFTRELRGAARYPENPMEVMLTLGEILTSPVVLRLPAHGLHLAALARKHRARLRRRLGTGSRQDDLHQRRQTLRLQGERRLSE